MPVDDRDEPTNDVENDQLAVWSAWLGPFSSQGVAPGSIQAAAARLRDLLVKKATDLVPAEEVENLAQDVFVDLLSKQPPPNLGDPMGWLYGILHHKATDYWRDRTRRRANTGHYLERVPDGTHGPDSRAEADDDMDWLHAHLARLPEKKRLVLQLRDFEGLTYEVIAERLELSTAVRARQVHQELLGLLWKKAAPLAIAREFDASACYIWLLKPPGPSFELASAGRADSSFEVPAQPRPGGWTEFICGIKTPVWITEPKDLCRFTAFSWNGHAWEAQLPDNAPREINQGILGGKVASELGFPVCSRGAVVAVAWLKFHKMPQRLPSSPEMCRLAEVLVPARIRAR